jgi:hypothetical protein
MLRVTLALLMLAATTVPALAQTGVTTPQTLPPSSSPSTVGPQSPSGTPSPFLTPQPFGTTSPIDPGTGLPSNLPPSSSTTRPGISSPSASPSTGAPSATTLPPPVWSSPSPPAGQPLTPGSR